MPAPPASLFARLSALTSPLGGTGAAPPRGEPVSALVGAATGGTEFAGLLAQQLRNTQVLAPPAGSQRLGTIQPASTQPALSPAGGSGRALTSAPRAVALATAGTGKKAGAAVAWAKRMVGRQDWNNLCQRFIEEAYGTRGVYPSAADAARETVTRRGRDVWRDAPVGALLYFAADESNGFNGHAGVYLGSGRMISARPTGVQEERLDTAYNQKLFVGWGEPTRLPGRAA